VIATSTRPIAPRVERGVFLPELYFALNGLTLYP
jgi:transcriptional regulator of acetoin/glycerol metabolism